VCRVCDLRFMVTNVPMVAGMIHTIDRIWDVSTNGSLFI
jgi:hypothetical protein